MYKYSYPINTIVFITLRKPDGGKDSTLEFRTFDPSKRSRKQISDILMEKPH